MSFLRKYARKYWPGFFISIAFVMCEALCDLMLPTLMSHIIDEGVAKSRMEVVLQYGGLMLLITAFGALAAVGRNLISSRVSQRFGTELRSDLFRKIQTFSFGNMDRFERASLITRLTSDVTQVQNFTNGLMRIFVKAPLLGLGALIMAARLNPQLAVILAVVVPLVGLLILLNMKAGFPRFMKVQKALDRVNGLMREYLSGVRVVRAFNRFDDEVDKFRATNADFQNLSKQAMRAMAIFNPAIVLTVNLGIIAVLWFGGAGVQDGSMQVGHIVAFVNYMTQVLFALMTVSMVFIMFARAKASALRIGEVFGQEGAMRWQEGASLQAGMSGRIDFEAVSFSYDGTPEGRVLKEVTFTCMPGETVGIIGSTGSGKSTLVHLLPRFYDATSGKVKVNGVDVTTVQPEQLRSIISIVPQKTVLFSGTILENIRWGKQDATPEEARRAAEVAEAHEFIAAQPEGYDTRIGQKGVNLSGGQKQRLSIARALVRQPRILILDDCTSALDAVTEGKIKAALKAYTRGLTCLLIAQRIASVMDADKIVVLDEGRVAGIGTHEELLSGCRVYQEIVHSQLGKEALTNVKAE
ncbi:ABC transporter ATP-binding protein [Paenibacillus sp. y28]|uniref:ABC transporter ATP-binding protein n=1 Tax=Paenibacillus sp. y28 TaxID=3129110 RepID=UPI00301A2A21